MFHIELLCYFVLINTQLTNLRSDVKKKKRAVIDRSHAQMPPLDPNVMPDITGAGIGRSTDYKPEYDQMLIDHMAKGLSFKSFGGVANVGTTTLYEWLKANASFQKSKSIGNNKCRLYWETIGVVYGVEGRSEEVVINGKKVRQKRTERLNPTVYRMNMMNRFPDDWNKPVPEDSAGPAVNLHVQIMEAIKAKRAKGKI